MRTLAVNIKRKRLLLYFWAVVFLLLISLFPKIYEHIEPYNLLNQLEVNLKRITGRVVLIDRVSITLEKGLRIRAQNVIVLDEEGKIFCRITALMLGVSVENLLRKKVHINSAVLEGLTLKLYTDEMKAKEQKVRTKTDLGKIFNKISVEDTEARDTKIIICKDKNQEATSQCLTTHIDKADISLNKGAAAVNMVGTIETPWYRDPIVISGKVKMKPSAPDLTAEAAISLSVPSLKLRDDWKERTDIVQTEGEVNIGVSGTLKDKRAAAQLEGNTAGITLFWKEKTLVLDTTSFSYKLSADGDSVSIENGSIATGPPGKEVTVQITGDMELGQIEGSNGEKRKVFKDAKVKVSFIAEDISSISNNSIWKKKQWSVWGKLRGEADIHAIGRQVMGQFDIIGGPIGANVPALYGTRSVILDSAHLMGNGSWPEGRIELHDSQITAGRTVIRLNGKAGFVGSKPSNASISIVAPLVSYKDVKPFLPDRKMKKGGKRFFLKELKAAELTNVEVQIKWDRSIRDIKKFLEKCVKGYAEVRKTEMDFGNVPASVASGKLSLYNGNLSFFDVKGYTSGTNLENLRVDIESLSQKPTFVIYLHNPILAENLASFLSAADFNMSGFFNGIGFKGWLYPSVVLEIPLRRGEKALLNGDVELKGASLAVDGVLPLMEDMSGRVELRGRVLNAPQLSFRIGRMLLNTSVSIGDFETPDADIVAFTQQALPADFFDAIPAKKEGGGQKESGSKKESMQTGANDNKKVNVRVALHAKKGNYRTLDFESLDTVFVVDDNGVNFDKLKMEFAGGRFRVDPPSRVLFAGPDIKFKFVAKDMDPYDFLKIFGVKNEVIRGNLNMDGDISTHGSSFDSIVAHQNGKIHFNIKDGQIEESNMLLSAFDLINFDFSKWKARKLGYRQIEGDIKITKGTLQSDSVVMNGFFMNIVAMGEINLPKEKMEIFFGLVPMGTVQNVAGKIPLVRSFFVSHSGKNYFAYYFRVNGNWDKYEVVQLGPEGVKDQLKFLLESIIELSSVR